MDTEISLTLFRNMMDVYESICQPVCRKGGISQTAFTILMFLASNPEHYTAKDVSTFRAIKPNIVSFNVEKLVKAGYLERQPIPGNRRSIKLVCTEKAEPMIKEGLKVIQNAKIKSERVLPMTKEVRECFETIISKRRKPKVEPIVRDKNGKLYHGFLYTGSK